FKYKAEWSGVNIVRIGRFEPSSKMCSECGWVKEDLTLKDRKWECTCGITHDRDINAAKNILQIGLKEQLFLGAGRPKVAAKLRSKPLENASLEGSMKEETQPSLAVG
ncbi:unnamed protein product, partial [marine sediment metagenome]